MVLCEERLGGSHGNIRLVRAFGLDAYGPDIVPFAGVFIDESASMYKDESGEPEDYFVRASLKMFLDKLKEAGLEDKLDDEDKNYEDWITPFMEDLA